MALRDGVHERQDRIRRQRASADPRKCLRSVSHVTRISSKS